MKMTKTVLAAAIAGIAATPMAASATTNLSGAVQMMFIGSDNEDDFTNTNGEDGFEDGELRLATDDVLVGITASQALNIGLTGYGSLRLDLNDFSGKSDANGDNVYLGVRGGFGDLRIGEVGNAGEYGQAVDILTDMGETINEGISLVGTLAGATVGVSWSPSTNQDIVAAGAKFDWKGLALGVGVQDFDEKVNFSAKAGFSFAGASVTLSGISLEDGFADGEDETALGANLGYSIAGVSVGLTFQAEQESEDSKVRLDASYGLGGGMTISTRINSTSPGDDDEDSTSDWRIKLSKSF